MGAELYKNLSNYFISHLTEVRAVRRGRVRTVQAGQR